MHVLVCPGIHDFQLTESFLDGLQGQLSSESSPNLVEKFLTFPAQNHPAYSAFHLLEFLRDRCSLESPLVFLSFSAGVVGAIGAAWAWQQWGGQVKAFVALDGWGVPLYGDFPIHRVSHDYFTHWSSALLGSGAESFYADPPVEHLALWRSPQTAQGWALPAPTAKTATHSTTAALFLTHLLARYGEAGA
jgi:hypothetical protein